MDERLVIVIGWAFLGLTLGSIPGMWLGVRWGYAKWDEQQKPAKQALDYAHGVLRGIFRQASKDQAHFDSMSE